MVMETRVLIGRDLLPVICEALGIELKPSPWENQAVQRFVLVCGYDVKERRQVATLYLFSRGLGVSRFRLEDAAARQVFIHICDVLGYPAKDIRSLYIQGGWEDMVTIDIHHIGTSALLNVDWSMMKAGEDDNDD